MITTEQNTRKAHLNVNSGYLRLNLFTAKGYVSFIIRKIYAFIKKKIDPESS